MSGHIRQRTRLFYDQDGTEMLASAEERLMALCVRRSTSWDTYKTIAKPEMFGGNLALPTAVTTRAEAMSLFDTLALRLGKGDISERRKTLRGIFSTAEKLKRFAINERYGGPKK